MLVVVVCWLLLCGSSFAFVRCYCLLFVVVCLLCVVSWLLVGCYCTSLVLFMYCLWFGDGCSLVLVCCSLFAVHVLWLLFVLLVVCCVLVLFFVCVMLFVGCYCLVSCGLCCLLDVILCLCCCFVLVVCVASFVDRRCLRSLLVVSCVSLLRIHVDCRLLLYVVRY